MISNQEEETRTFYLIFLLNNFVILLCMESSERMGIPESVSNKELSPKEVRFTDKAYDFGYQLIKSKVITALPLNDPSGDRANINIQAAPGVIERLGYSQFVENAKAPVSDSEKASLPEYAQKSYRKVVKSFVDRGILSPEQVVSIGRIIRPENIVVRNQPAHQFLYLRDAFPETPESRGQIRISEDSYAILKNRVGGLLSELNVTLSPEQLNEVAMRWGISHEYGHAVDTALILSLTEKRLKDHPEEPLSQANVEAANSLYKYIYDVSAPNADLNDILAIDNNEMFSDKTSTSSERIAGGFEYLGLRFALEDSGVEPEKIDSMIKKLLEKKAHYTDEAKQFSSVLKDNGFSMQAFSSGMGKLWSDLRSSGNKEITNKMPMSVIDARSLGYLAPLRKPEVQHLVSLFPQKQEAPLAA